MPVGSELPGTVAGENNQAGLDESDTEDQTFFFNGKTKEQPEDRSQSGSVCAQQPYIAPMVVEATFFYVGRGFLVSCCRPWRDARKDGSDRTAWIGGEDALAALEDTLVPMTPLPLAIFLMISFVSDVVLLNV